MRNLKFLSCVAAGKWWVLHKSHLEKAQQNNAFPDVRELHADVHCEHWTDHFWACVWNCVTLPSRRRSAAHRYRRTRVPQEADLRRPPPKCLRYSHRWYQGALAGRGRWAEARVDAARPAAPHSQREDICQHMQVGSGPRARLCIRNKHGECHEDHDLYLHVLWHIPNWRATLAQLTVIWPLAQHTPSTRPLTMVERLMWYYYTYMSQTLYTQGP